MPNGKFAAKNEVQEHLEEKRVKRQKRRQITLYDAVAGRVNSHGFIPSIPYASKHRDTASSTTVPVRPEEVLFRQKNAPTRYEETDFYFANENLSPDNSLPNSELLEAIHAFSADFYGQATADRGRTVHRSMDETALIATGILLEEMAKESLGKTGDLVLVEGEEIPTDEDEPTSTVGRRIRRKRANTGQTGAHASSGDDLERVAKRHKRSKKRRLARKASTTDIETEVEERREAW